MAIASRLSAAAVAIWACAVVVTIALTPGAMATNHVVGGSLGWHVSRVEGKPTFYQEWANSDGSYFLGDTLEFQYTPGDAVVRVSDAAGFEACGATRALGLFNEGHTIFPLVPPLVHAQRVYFISGDRVSCDVGLKFFVDVVE